MKYILFIIISLSITTCTISGKKVKNCEMDCQNLHSELSGITNTYCYCTNGTTLFLRN